MSYTKRDNFETNDDVQEEHNGFVPVQYKILKLEADYIISCPKKQMPKEKGTGTIDYYDVPAYELKDWLTMNHGNNGLISVGDDILFHKIRELKAAENDEVTEETPNEEQKKYNGLIN